MSQTYEAPISNVAVSALRSKLNNTFDALVTCHSGTSAPSSPVAGMLFFNTATSVLSVYNGSTFVPVATVSGAASTGIKSDGSVAFAADQSLGSNKLTNLAAATAAADAVRKAQVDAVVHSQSFRLGDISATGNYSLLALPQNVTVSDVSIVTTASLTSSGTDFWEVNARNVTGAVDLKAADYSTFTDGDFTANQRNAIGLDQNLTPSAGNALRVDFTKNGAIGNLTDVLVTVEYLIAL